MPLWMGLAAGLLIWRYSQETERLAIRQLDVQKLDLTICDANNLYRAYKVSVKTSKWKETTQKFMMNFLRYIFSIQEDLMNRTLQNGPTQEFTLFERGRVRPITSIQIRDRIIRHVLCDEVLLPEVKKHIIYDNCASIKGRGINKVIYGGETLIDLTGDTVTADKILSGFTAHDKGGGVNHRYL